MVVQTRSNLSLTIAGGSTTRGRIGRRSDHRARRDGKRQRRRPRPRLHQRIRRSLRSCWTGSRFNEAFYYYVQLVTNVLAVETSKCMLHRALMARMPEALAATHLHPHATCAVAELLLHNVMGAREAGRVVPERVMPGAGAAPPITVHAFGSEALARVANRQRRGLACARTNWTFLNAPLYCHVCWTCCCERLYEDV